MNKLELDFRKELFKSMDGLWVGSIHVENHLNPGIPDCSYVMLGGDYETGWLELKAIDEEPPYAITIERSQHVWIQNHHSRVPVHLLISTGQVCWLVPGEHHGMFAKRVHLDQLVSKSVCGFQRAEMRSILHAELKRLTDRSRSRA